MIHPDPKPRARSASTSCGVIGISFALLFAMSQWMTANGPIQQYVLADIYSWLEAHSGLSQSYFNPTVASTMEANASPSNTNKTSP